MLADVAVTLARVPGRRERSRISSHDGEPLARALEKIEAYAKQRPMKIDPAHAQAYIINPLAGQKVEFANLFSSHPPTADRIRRAAHRAVLSGASDS